MRLKSIKICLIILFFLPILAFAITDSERNEILKLLQKHYQQYKTLEYFSGISLAVSIPGQEIDNFNIGRISHEPTSPAITAAHLYQIGSITKSFTAAILLQLEAEKKLSMNDKLGDHLDDYKKWSHISIKSLLNMTSGLPNYSDTPLWNAAIYEQPQREWSSQDLIRYVYPSREFNPPLKAGYFYTNTAYILSGLIAEKASMQTIQQLMQNVITKANLKNTFYPTSAIQKELLPRMVHGYNFNQYDNPNLVGNDVTAYNLSWAAAAGGMISNAQDIIIWVRALFEDEELLKPTQRHELMQLISTTSGQAIPFANAKSPHAFGLGVVQGYDPQIGLFWFYQGETIGYRALYLYVPCNRIIVSGIFNSAVNEENNHASDLLIKTYQILVKNNAKMQCKKIN